MDFSRLWVEVTIAGYLFVAAIFFLLLAILGQSDVAFLNQMSALVPALGITIAAYVLGVSAHLLLRWFIQTFWSKEKYDAERDVSFFTNASESFKQRAKFAEGVHVMFRLLTLGTICLWLSVSIWLCATDQKQLIAIVSLIFAFFAIGFALVYFSHRETYARLKEAIDKHYKNQ